MKKSNKPCFGAHNPTEIMGCPEWCKEWKECYEVYIAPKCQVCGTHEYVMETITGLICEKCADEQAKERLGIVTDEVNGGKTK